VQIVQWTISSTPHHPIALDVLRQITHQTANAIDWRSKQSQLVQDLVKAGESERAEKINRASILSEPKEGGPVGVMDWTGPGVWTDAVLR
jgi:alpha 1,6-mannosyltransferase